MTDWHPHVTVATVIEKDDQFLLVEEQGAQGLVLNQPAGHLDPNENLQQAAVRETLEETGWHVKIQGLLGIALYTAPANGVTYHRTTFYGQLLREEPNYQLDTGIEGIVWLSHEEMLRQSARMRSPLVLASVEQYLHGDKLPLEFIYSSQ
jgi:8-oxo-dGTP pyrophosphatase MutT (NUDIX family)